MLIIYSVFRVASYGDYTMCWITGVQFLAGTDIFLCATKSRLALGPTLPVTQGVLGTLSIVRGEA